MTKIMKGGIAYNSTANMVALTQAEYDALSTAQKNNGNFYCITDADPSYFSAENIDYDNTDSGLSATNIQGAIDEIDSGLSEKADSSNVYTKTQIDAMLPKMVYTNLEWENQHSFVADLNQAFICYTDSDKDCVFIRIYSNGTVSFKVISGTNITSANFANQRLNVNTNNKGLIVMQIA